MIVVSAPSETLTASRNVDLSQYIVACARLAYSASAHTLGISTLMAFPTMEMFPYI